MLQAKILLILAAVCCGLLTPVVSQNTYGCSGADLSKRRLTNYGKYTFILHALAPNSSYLEPNMDCTITIIGYSSSRWLVTLDTISLSAYQAEFDVYEGTSTRGKNLISLNSAGTLYRQLGISSGSFTVRQKTKSTPAGKATGVRMTVEHLETSDCPTGWYKVSSSAGYCYGVPRLALNLTYDESAKACNMLLANLVMGNFNYDSISAELFSAPSSVVSPRLTYWVGMYEKNDELKFLNKYNSLDSISGRLCSQTSSDCQCITYQSGRFYKDNCNTRRQYVCYMPKGGTESYYNLKSQINSASNVISMIAIVLTVGFILVILVSLIVVFVCCIRRNAAARRTRRQSNFNAANSNVNAGPFVIGEAAGVPPSYPMPPPPPPFTASPAAPPYTATAPAYSTYSNLGFEAGGNDAAAPATSAGASGGDNGEKPPPYNPDWSRNNVAA
ncbi:hypothetical protein BOX15_Mlig018315g1 [Macrostomum lignano]|uniref:Uncharacterized protein n=2 Tax=Macrostomum lignano TaxID=282301 RepID=A0A267EWN7_9PLAT|nr:hypothetical protein BOX15_Mlig018315g2 [Macrostomum lignano]PAA65913.1 hypothetical protein BOX15_Mlig018315g1 [Macrostomum lignano]